MKSIIITIFISMQLMAFSQISLVKSYEGSAGLSQVKQNTLRYYSFNAVNNQCVIFNEQHQEIDGINLSLTSAQTLYSITYLSENLFDLDEKLELVYTYSEWFQVDTIWYLSYNSKIVNEDGELLVEILGAQYITVTNNTVGSELLAWTYDFSLSSYPIETLVYHLPGNYSKINEEKSGEEYTAWPNPCSQQIFLPLTDGAQEIRVYNEQGQLIDIIISNNNEPHLKYQVNHLSSGIYLYQTISKNKVGKMNKFIIH